MSEHFKEYCNECGIIMSQCRCFKCDKEIRVSLCEKCKQGHPVAPSVDIRVAGHVNALRSIQDAIQRSFPLNKIDTQGGIWITIDCPHCEHNIRTVYWLKETNQCPKCGKTVLLVPK